MMYLREIHAERCCPERAPRMRREKTMTEKRDVCTDEDAFVQDEVEAAEDARALNDDDLEAVIGGVKISKPLKPKLYS